MMHVKFYEKKSKGKGVFAAQYIPKGTLIWKLTNSKRYSKEEYKNLPGHVKKDVYLDGKVYVHVIGKGGSVNAVPQTVGKNFIGMIFYIINKDGKLPSVFRRVPYDLASLIENAKKLRIKVSK